MTENAASERKETTLTPWLADIPKMTDFPTKVQERVKKNDQAIDQRLDRASEGLLEIETGYKKSLVGECELPDVDLTLQRVARQIAKIGDITDHTELYQYSWISRRGWAKLLQLQNLQQGHKEFWSSKGFEGFHVWKEIVPKELDEFVEDGQRMAEDNQEFGKSDSLLWHIAPFDLTLKILERKKLASRIIQEAEFGKSEFTTGARKHPRQELHQLVFSEDWAYRAARLEGVALVFSEQSLFGKTQWTEAEGYHLFHRNFSKNNPVGLSISLEDEPFMILVENDKKEEFLERVKAESGIDEEWIRQHTMIVPMIDKGEIRGSLEKQKRVRRNLTVDIRREFFRRFGKEVEMNPGFIVPTGNEGQGPARSWHSLYTYKDR